MCKRIRDPIHRFVHVEEQDSRLIDHRLVQRLRWVSQLPLEQLVYPSAQHSRFEHSLGTMHLADQAAKALLDNSAGMFAKACEEDEHFRPLEMQGRRELFIRCAKACGLLHDIGHAPFSHTLEDACNHLLHIPYRYDHEEVGFHLAKHVLSDANYPATEAAIVNQVLNKKLKDEDLNPPEMVLRRLIDSDLDVDKGDYVLRDAYHCGVSYGIYDPDLLWENIVITDSYDIGVKEKAAIEAWTLSLARYKMFQYVYKHHIRNITDALLIDMIISVLGQEKESFDQEILPVQDPEQVNNDKLLSNFVYWTDNTMLKALSEKGGPSAANKIAKFSKRELYKRSFAVALNKYPNASGNEDEVRRIARTKQREYEEKDTYWNFILFNDVPPPVLEKRVQDNIKVLTNDGRCTPLAHFLGFALDQFNWDAEDVEYPVPETKLHVFIEEGSSGHTRQVQSQLESALEHDLGMGLH